MFGKNKILKRRLAEILVAVFFVAVFVPQAGAVPSQKDYVMVPPADQVAVRQNKIDVRDLGYAPFEVIPPGQSAITALMKGRDGNIYGGTSGTVAHLFVYFPESDKVKPLGKIDGQQGIYHSIVEANDGAIYIGTMGSREGDGIVQGSLDKYSKNYEGGHLYRYDSNGQKERKVTINDKCQLTDLGIPVSGDGIYTLTYGSRYNELYGITFPNGHFFVYNLDTCVFSDKGRVFEESKIGAREHFRSIPRALICDDAGNVYGSWDKGRLFKYDAKKREMIKLSLQLPGVKGRQFLNVIDCLVKDKSGIIYGGTSDGYLFKFNPEQMKISNLGKPVSSLRMRALTIAPDGKLYGVAGEESSICSLFSYDPSTAEYDNLGLLESYRKPYYSWLGYQFDSAVAGDDGAIYLGESDRKSHLYIFYP